MILVFGASPGFSLKKPLFWGIFDRANLHKSEASATLRLGVRRHLNRSNPTTSVAQASRPAAIRLGERVRQLRVAAGLTQSELARRSVLEGVREPDRARQDAPDRRDDQLAREPARGRRGYLANGVSTDERGRVEATLTRAEALVEAHRYEEAVGSSSSVRPAVAHRRHRARGAAAVRQRPGRGCTRGSCAKRSSCSRARARSPSRAVLRPRPRRVLYRLGVCRYKLSSISTAIGLFNEAYAIAERSELPCDVLRSNILAYRSRCYRRQRDLEAAREDVGACPRAGPVARRHDDDGERPTSRPRSSPSASATRGFSGVGSSANGRRGC